MVLEVPGPLGSENRGLLAEAMASSLGQMILSHQWPSVANFAHSNFQNELRPGAVGEGESRLPVGPESGSIYSCSGSAVALPQHRLGAGAGRRPYCAIRRTPLPWSSISGKEPSPSYVIMAKSRNGVVDQEALGQETCFGCDFSSCVCGSQEIKEVLPQAPGEPALE